MDVLISSFVFIAMFVTFSPNNITILSRTVITFRNECYYTYEFYYIYMTKCYLGLLLHLGLNVITLRTFIPFRTKCYYI